MWVSKASLELVNNANEAAESLRRELFHLRGLFTEADNERLRLRADLDWFKLRLNQVERERGQLIQAAIGVKIAVPEFVPTYEDPGRALNEMPDLSTVGGDAADQGSTTADPGEGVDFSMMPGYKGK